MVWYPKNDEIKKKNPFRQTKAERTYYKKTYIMRTIKGSSSHKRNMILDGAWIYTKEWRVKKKVKNG